MSRVDEPCSSIILAWCEIRERLQIDAQGFFRPVRALSQVRNPSIADVFFGMRSMERVGSGLADVEDEMQRSGGKAVFSVDLRQQMFRATLYQPLQGAPGPGLRDRLHRWGFMF